MKNKRPLPRLMILGITGGIILNNPLSAEDSPKQAFPSLMQLAESTNGNIASHQMTADELMLEVTDEGAKKFNALTPEGKELALKIASRGCNNENECKGQNACKTKDNQCAGQGQCKGTTKCAISDKNLAVELAAKIMADKRKALETGATGSKK